MWTTRTRASCTDAAVQARLTPATRQRCRREPLDALQAHACNVDRGLCSKRDFAGRFRGIRSGCSRSSRRRRRQTQRSRHFQARPSHFKIGLHMYLNQLTRRLITSSAEKQHRKKISNKSNTSPALVGWWFSSRSFLLSCASAMVRAKF